ncbi:phosphotriesterase-related protein [Streptomyces sp. DSM 44917]|uniref:Phosphotriesterase-related protein n=1 Tax=Streptomyces boetiae TaxID=3075541 RepID=A0ABU2LDD1_9ACTN|nr:phosphotriesterase-related protein [Streptomyces sp. DSM 44917]MDT0309590.1 phosphotriesterase-related protein [Streptomyces sp. DSM 44917]
MTTTASETVKAAPAPGAVSTVRGPVSVGDLGVTLMHEHLFVLTPDVQQNQPHLWDEEERIEDAVTKLMAAYDQGVRSFVDLTAIGQGRFIPRVKRVAERVPLNILVATGVYTYHDVPYFFHYRGPGRLFDGPEPMTELFVEDLTRGIADTGVRAAVLKCATEEPTLSEGVERVLRATAQAHRETGAPITTHSNAFVQNGLLQQKVLAEEGVDLSHVIIGHSGDTDDLDYLKRLMDAGSTIGMDRFGLDNFTPHEKRVKIVADLVAAGYADRMVLSHDCPCFIDYFTEEQMAKTLPDWDYTHLHKRVLPALHEQGVSEHDIRTMLIDNPRRYFTPVAPY